MAHEIPSIAPKESVIFLFYKAPGFASSAYRDGKILVEKRGTRPNDHYANKTVLPGGKVDEEDRKSVDRFRAALLREAQEELSVLPTTLIRLFDEERNISPKGDVYNSRVYLITEWEGEINFSKAPEKATPLWININEAENELPLEFSQRIIAAARRALSI